MRDFPSPFTSVVANIVFKMHSPLFSETFQKCLTPHALPRKEKHGPPWQMVTAAQNTKSCLHSQERTLPLDRVPLLNVYKPVWIKQQTQSSFFLWFQNSSAIFQSLNLETDSSFCFKARCQLLMPRWHYICLELIIHVAFWSMCTSANY